MYVISSTENIREILSSNQSDEAKKIITEKTYGSTVNRFKFKPKINKNIFFSSP